MPYLVRSRHTIIFVGYRTGSGGSSSNDTDNSSNGHLLCPLFCQLLCQGIRVLFLITPHNHPTRYVSLAPFCPWRKPKPRELYQLLQGCTEDVRQRGDMGFWLHSACFRHGWPVSPACILARGWGCGRRAGAPLHLQSRTCVSPFALAGTTS